MIKHNINELIEIDLTVMTITLILERVFPPSWIHEQKSNRSSHGIVFILEGSAEFVTEDTLFTVNKGDVVFLPKGSRYSTTTASSSEYHFITASFQLNRDDILIPLPIGVMVKCSNENFYRNIFKDLVGSWFHKGLAYKIKCKEILYQILYQLFFDSIEDKIHSRNFNKIQPAIKFMDNNYEKELIFEGLCDLCQLSATHFRRLFKEACGVSPLVYLNSIRIAKSKDLLLSNMYTIGEIASKTGFSDMCYFSRCFKKATGKCPSSFQRTML